MKELSPVTPAGLLAAGRAIARCALLLDRSRPWKCPCFPFLRLSLPPFFFSFCSSELEPDVSGDWLSPEAGEGPPAPASPTGKGAALAGTSAAAREGCKTSKVTDALQRANSFHSSALNKYQNWRRKIQMNFPLLSSRKNGLQSKDSSASCQSALGKDHSQTQLSSYKKSPEVTRGHFKPYSPVFQRREKAREMIPEDICFYVPHGPFHGNARCTSLTLPGNGTLATDFSEPENIDGETGKHAIQDWNEKKQEYTSEPEDFNRKTEVLSAYLEENSEKNTRHLKEKHEQELKEAKRRITRRLTLYTEQQPALHDSNRADLDGASLEHQRRRLMGISEKDAARRKDVFKPSTCPTPLLLANSALPPALPADTKGAWGRPDAATKERVAGRPRSPLRLIASAIRRSILEPLTSPPEGLKQNSHSKAKASPEHAFFSFPNALGHSLRQTNNNRANNTQPQELKAGEQAGEYLGNGSLSLFNSSVVSEEIAPRDDTQEATCLIYSPHSMSSMMADKPQKSSCTTRMEDVPGLLEKFTFKETLPRAPMDDLLICNEKYLVSPPEPKNNPCKDNLDDSAQKNSLGMFFERLRSKVSERERNSFASSLPFAEDCSPEERLNYPSAGCTGLPVRRQAAECSSSSDDEFESKASLTHKAKGSLRRRRKLEKETKQLIKQEELKRLHKAQAIQRQLEELEERQRALEIFGVKLERKLRGESDSGTQDETQMLHEWFELVLEKNKLMRYESELLIIAQELELEDHQSRLEQKLREKMAVDDSLKDEMHLNEEGEIFTEMMKVVEQRDILVSTLEEQRVKEKTEDQHFENFLLPRGYQLSRI
ncbi:F-actin-monooxygenase MICAL2-like [Rhea pennata]|uniref:F-actin-monooxygenase MICAL2-like n=1 Tax=Rhea pennata TaxID=8795 RepID=UPI002E2683EF